MREIWLAGSECKNLCMLKKCSSLKQLYLCNCSFDEIQRKNDNLVLLDSTIFSEFDSVDELYLGSRFEDYKIKDLNGFLKMKSLKYLGISKNNMTKEQIEKLESAGIEIEIAKD